MLLLVGLPGLLSLGSDARPLMLDGVGVGPTAFRQHAQIAADADETLT